MISHIANSPSASNYASLPVIGHGPEPVWFTRRVAAVTRLHELERERQIARLTGRRDRSDGVVARIRSAFNPA